MLLLLDMEHPEPKIDLKDAFIPFWDFLDDESIPFLDLEDPEWLLEEAVLVSFFGKCHNIWRSSQSNELHPSSTLSNGMS